MSRLVPSCLALGITSALRPVLAPVLLLASFGVGAACTTVGNTTSCDAAAPNPWGDGLLIGTNSRLEVAEGSAVVVLGTAATDIAVRLTSGVTVVNRGTIRSSDLPAIYTEQPFANNTIINEATGLIQGDADAIFGTNRSGLTLINRGRIIGDVTLDSGQDQVDMSGSLDGSIRQGAGDDTLLLRTGGLITGGVDQGDGADLMEVTGGTINGTVQQGNGTDTFRMSAGTLGALLQGDNFDYFYMTGGRIIGAFEDGDYAEMSGGRIGRVNMKLDNNVFDMSGGTIDGNLVTGFGRDTIILSDGYIGGNISVSGGDDSITIKGGTVRGELRLSVGNDVLDWSGGGVVHGLVDMGEGDDNARLANLNQAHLGALPGFDGGLGQDRLQMDNVKTTGVARYTGWERIALADDSQLTFDGRLLLGDADSGTGVLDIDASSALFASGSVGAVAAFNAGALASVNNAGRIDLSSNHRAGDVFTIAGNYAGSGGGLYLDSVLAGDGAASDRLVIAGGTASGVTGIGIINAGGSGAATMADGILVVQALNGATTSPGSFAQLNGLSVGAYEYFLFKGGVSAGTSENWYLRSTVVTPPPAPDPVPTPEPAPAPSPQEPPVIPFPPPPPEDLGTLPPPLPPPPPVPGVDPDPIIPEPAPPPEPTDPAPVPEPTVFVPEPVPVVVAPVPTPVAVPPTPGARLPRGTVTPIYRLETPTYAVVPSLLRTLGQAILGTFHQRQGAQGFLSGDGTLRAAWGRVIGSSVEQRWQGDALTGFDGDLQGIQAGVDIHASDDGDFRSQWGALVGRTRASGDITGLALGWENVRAGRLRIDDKHAGLTWTGTGSAGGYVDVVALRSRYQGHATSTRGLGLAVRGDGTTVSVEAGKPLLRLGGSNWWLEPQLQVIWQQQSLDDGSDVVSTVRFDADDAWTGRVGVRLTGDPARASGRWQPYLKLDYWQTMSGEDHTDFGSNRITALQATRAWELGVGVVGRINERAIAYATADYTADLEDDDRHQRGIEGNVGVRVDW